MPLSIIDHQKKLNWGEEKMPRYSILKNVMSVSVVTLALGAAFAEARGVGAGHQTTIQTAAVGRATNPSQMKSLIYDAVVDNCDALNCGAVFMNGNSQRNNLGDLVPFTAEVYADANECLRLEVIYQDTKVPPQPADTYMRIVLVSPIGSVWRSDNSYNTRPVVTARTDVKGHYTVQINK
jgi:hypothetical protein